MGGLHAKVYIVLIVFLISRQILEAKTVIECRLQLLKAVRFGRNELVWWVSWDGQDSFGRILISRAIVENQICDPASAGFFEGRQIWEVRFKRTRSLGFLRGLT